MSALHTYLVLTLAISCGVLGYPVKGGGKGHNASGGQWTQPKDWDWSVTTGRLIPVSEATDDLPTPGYRMSDLQQKVPTGRSLVKSEESTVGNSVESKATNKVEPETNVSKEEVVQNDTERTISTQTTEVDTVKKELSSTTEADEPKKHHNIVQEQEKLPVIEETIKKVILPELCSISGIGCGDRRRPVEEKTTTIDNESTEKSQSTETLYKVDEIEQETERNPQVLSSSTTLHQETTSDGTTHSEGASTTQKIDNLINENVDEHIQQTERISTHFPVNSSTNVPSTATIEASSSTVSPQEDRNLGGNKDSDVPQESQVIEEDGQSLEAHVQKLDNFDYLQQHIKESAPPKYDQGHVNTATVDDQNPLSTGSDNDQKPLITEFINDQKPLSAGSDNDQKPLPAEFSNDQKPLPAEFSNDQKPLPTEFGNDQKPLPAEFGNDQKPLPAEFNNDQKPLPAEFNNDQKPLPAEFNDDQKPLPTGFSNDEKPLPAEFGNDQKPLSSKFEIDHQKPLDTSEESNEDRSEVSSQQKPSPHVTHESSEESSEGRLQQKPSLHVAHDSSESLEDTQKLLQPFEIQRRIDDAEELTQQVEEQKTVPVYVESDVKDVSEEEQKLMKSEYVEGQQVPTTKEEPESLSFADRITSYWRAATGYVSKALNI